MFTIWDESNGLEGIKGLQKKAAKGDLDAARKLEKKAAKKAAKGSGGVSSSPVVSTTIPLPSPAVGAPNAGSVGMPDFGSMIANIPPIVLYGGLAVVAFLLFRGSGKKKS